jgi:protein ImuB
MESDSIDSMNQHWLCIHLPGPPAGTLARLAAWCGQFSSFVSISAPHSLVLEAGGSLKLFGGIERLAAQIKSGLRALDFSSRIAAAPTPLAAELFACAEKETFVARNSELPRALGELAVDVLPLDAAQLRLLHGMGLNLLGDVMRLPRDGLARRFGPAFVRMLDRALGRCADVRIPFVPPPHFDVRLELPAPTGNLEALAFALQRLFREMEGFLRARQAGVRAFRLQLFCGPSPTIIEMPLLTCSRDAEHLLKLARTRLESIALPEAVEAIALSTVAIEPLPDGQNGVRDIFRLPLPDSRHVSPFAFIERLQARFGEDVVQRLDCVADHRPERAYRMLPVKHNRGSGFSRETLPNHASAAEAAPTGFPGSVRPFWLLREPASLAMHDQRPCLDGMLELNTNRERIESGWWDGGPIARDYFIAHDRHGRRLWVYRDLASGGWFLQGMFG